MVKFVLIRHGITQWNSSGRFQGQSDVPLVPRGIEQAEQLAADFPLPKVDRFFSSPLKRAYATGEIIASKLGVPITSDPRLMEISFGLWEGLTIDQVNAKWAGNIKDLFARPAEVAIPEGESFAQVQQRGMAFIREILDKYHGETIGITAHGGILRALICAMLQIPLNNLWCLRQDNTAVNIISKYPDNPAFIAELINGTAHLQCLPESTKSGM